MGGGNGAKSAAARAKNQKDAAARAGGASQLKSNVGAMNVQCQTCKQPFLSTVNQAQLQVHAENKHNKKLGECFPHLAVAA